MLLPECLIFFSFNVSRWCLNNQYMLCSLMPSMYQFEQKHIDSLQVHVQQEVIYRCFRAFTGLKEIHASTHPYIFLVNMISSATTTSNIFKRKLHLRQNIFVKKLLYVWWLQNRFISMECCSKTTLLRIISVERGIKWSVVVKFFTLCRSNMKKDIHSVYSPAS